MTKPTNDPDLDLFFTAARDTGPSLPDELRTRILADADAALRTSVAPRPRLRLARLLRGWLPPSLAGGLTAAIGGFWIGAASSLPVAALDVPDWLDQTLIYVDMVTVPLLGVTDLTLGGL